jgi:biotin carboxylase
MTRRIALVHPVFSIPFIFEQAEKNGIEFVVILPPGEQPPPAHPTIAGCEFLSIYDDPAGAMRDLEPMAKKWRFDAIMATKEARMVWTARAAKTLGLRGIEPAAARAARDKAEMRRLFRRHGLTTPEFVRINGVDELARCAEVPFPCIVKPRSGFNSDGVELVSDREALRAAILHIQKLNERVYRKASWDTEDNYAGIVVEEFLPGAEYVVELFALDGDVRPLNCGYKGQPAGPYFEESVYLSPPPLDPAAVKAIQDVAVGGMRALGLTNGPGHCELRLNARGEPVILEIGARIGGSGCAHFNVEGSTGVDFFNLWFSYLLGAAADTFWPPRPWRKQQAASSWILPLGGSGVFRSIEGLDAARSHPECDRILVLGEVGKRYRPYPDFDGFPAIVFGKHPSARAGMEFFDFLQQTLRVAWTP